MTPVKFGAAVLLALLSGCSGNAETSTVQSQFTTVSGKIVATNQAPANSTKAAVVRIRDSKGKIVKVIFPAGPTQNIVREASAKLRVGGIIEVTGDKTKQDEIIAYKTGHELKVNSYAPS